MKTGFRATMGCVAAFSGGELVCGSPDETIDTISTDSRELGRLNLFVPIRGEKYDGHDFIEELASSGKLRGFLTMRKNDIETARRCGLAMILCDDTLKAYGNIAGRHRDAVSPRVVGITGTNGKTTIKEMVWTVLKKKYSCIKNRKNYNNEIGVPYTLLGLCPGTEYAVIEMGMNHPGEIDRLTRMARPDIAVISNVGEGHLEFLGSMDNVALAKLEILNGMKEGSTVVLNRDTRMYERLSNACRERGFFTRTFGLEKNADLCPDEYRLDKKSISFWIGRSEITIPLYGVHNLYNALAAVCVAQWAGIEMNTIGNALGSFAGVGMRGQIIEGAITIIDDTYNSNPLSVRYALESMAKVFPSSRKIAVLADMKELGEHAERLHREVGVLAADAGVDRLCTYGDLAEFAGRAAAESGVKNGIAHFTDKGELVRYLKRVAETGDVVLIKGSRSMKMEEVVDALVR